MRTPFRRKTSVSSAEEVELLHRIRTSPSAPQPSALEQEAHQTGTELLSPTSATAIVTATSTPTRGKRRRWDTETEEGEDRHEDRDSVLEIVFATPPVKKNRRLKGIITDSPPVEVRVSEKAKAAVVDRGDGTGKVEEMQEKQDDEEDDEEEEEEEKGNADEEEEEEEENDEERGDEGRPSRPTTAWPRNIVDDPPTVYIPSKQRCNKARGTISLLALAGIPAFVVVEPQEAADYRKWLDGSIMTVVVLPENDKGVGYCRNQILEMAPPTGWFWVLDDDIFHFVSFSKDGKEIHPVSPVQAFREADLENRAADPKIAICALEYLVFMVHLSRSPEKTQKYGSCITNSYCNVCVAINKSRLPPGIRYYFKVHEDYDFALQLIEQGYKTLRLRFLGFDAPQMATRKGGMHDFYHNRERESIVQTMAFLLKWPTVSTKVFKGKNKRLDVKVKWGSAARILRGGSVEKEKEKEKEQ